VAGIALEDVHGWITTIGVAVVTGRDIHPQGTIGRIAEPVADQGGAVDDVTVDATG
jgi:hypothetical protein